MAPSLSAFNGQLAADRAAALDYVPRMAAAYQRVLASLSADFLRKLRQRSQVVTAAAAWPIPNADELYDLVASIAMLTRAGERKRVELLRTTMEGVLVSHGINWDVKNPAVKGVLEGQLGAHITRVAEDHRDRIMAVLEQAWEDGLSIPHAAQAIQTVARVDNAARAARIARTEIGAAVNGGSLAAATMLGIAPYKQWVATFDGRTRPDHAHVSGQVVPLRSNFLVGGYSMQHPGDQNAPPSETVHCRCTLVFTEGPAGMAGIPNGEQIEAQARRDEQRILDQSRLDRQRSTNRRIDRQTE